MEIKKITKDEEKRALYPKQNEISKNKIKNKIPNIWKKIGVNSLIISILLRKRTFAGEFRPNPPENIPSGAAPNPVIQIAEISKFLAIFLIPFLLILGRSIYVKKVKKQKISKLNLVIASVIILLNMYLYYSLFTELVSYNILRESLVSIPLLVLFMCFGVFCITVYKMIFMPTDKDNEQTNRITPTTFFMILSGVLIVVFAIQIVIFVSVFAD